MSVLVSLPRLFYARPAVTVARELLGTRLVRMEGDQRLSGIIVETEAYSGEEDLGCHCRHGRTPRTQVMFGLAGHAYVYFTYGMHWCLNFVVAESGYPAAVLIRSIQPVEGLEVIASRRGSQPAVHWSNGPGKLTQALNITGSHNGADLCAPEADLFVVPGFSIPDEQVITGGRVGLNTVPEPWKSIPWRFRIAPVHLPVATNLPGMG
jgi:DNA-3-methyladenine glycosylase